MHQPPLRGRQALVGKKVLLVDPYQPTRDARAGVLRNHDIELDTAESLRAARCLWRPRLYDWVLLDVRGYLPGEALAFYEQIRDKSPGEHVAFFVGPPTYLSRTCPDQSSEVASETQQWGETVKRFLAAA
jgi:response regulator RpfG family c-di-GMP phosphodiesterase